MWSVALIIRLGPCELLEHLAASRRRAPIIELILAPRKLLDVLKKIILFF